MDTSKIKEAAGRAFQNKGVLATVAVAALIGAGAIGYAIGDEHDGHHDGFDDEYGMHGFGPHGDEFRAFPPPPPGMKGEEGRPPMGVPGESPQGAPILGQPGSEPYGEQHESEEQR